MFIIVDRTKEAQMLRSFLGLNNDASMVRNSTVTNTDVDNVSCVSSSVLGSEG